MFGGKQEKSMWLLFLDKNREKNNIWKRYLAKKIFVALPVRVDFSHPFDQDNFIISIFIWHILHLALDVISLDSLNNPQRQTTQFSHFRISLFDPFPTHPVLNYYWWMDSDIYRLSKNLLNKFQTEDFSFFDAYVIWSEVKNKRNMNAGTKAFFLWGLT